MTEINQNKIIIAQNCSSCDGHDNHIHTSCDEPEYIEHQYLGELKDAKCHMPSFLSVTNNKFDFSNLEGLVFSDGIQKEIIKCNKETDRIEELTRNNTTEYNVANLGDFTSKKIDFEKYKGTQITFKNLNKKTDTSKILSNLQYSDKYDTEAQSIILTGAIEKLANWLDDSITNYEKKVSEGKEYGDSEVKLSFLLRMRKAIENCDFPIGFGDNEIFERYSCEGKVVIGEYSNSSNANGFLNKTYSGDNNNIISNHTDRNIILNAGAFVQDRKYSSENELLAAIKNGEFAELKEAIQNGTATKTEVTKAFSDITMASDDIYYNYREVYLASILAQELIRSTHIANEVIAENTLELIQDDFKDLYINRNWSEAATDAIQSFLYGLDVNTLRYRDIFIQTGEDSALGFKDLAAYSKYPERETILDHGHEANIAYGNMLYGYGIVNKDDDKNELMNFIV